jgi:hypothetical protein
MAVSTTGEHQAVPEQKPPTVTGALLALANLVFKRDAILWAAAIAVLLFAGGFGVVWAQDKLDGGVEVRVAPLEKRMDANERELAEVKKTSAEALRVSMETNLNVRLIAERLNLRPITLETADGGR